jgi:hypothetical protein
MKYDGFFFFFFSFFSSVQDRQWLVASMKIYEG